jgi:Protein of unknown function (DUF2281)
VISLHLEQEKQMNAAEQELLEKWRYLPLDQQREVLDFAEFLVQKVQRQHRSTDRSENLSSFGQEQKSDLPKNPLGKRLRELRAKIVASGERLLTVEEIEQEMASQRNRLGELEE